MRKTFISLLMFAFLFFALSGSVSADVCSPSGGYTSCYEWSDHYTYDGARAESYVQIQGTEVQGIFKNGYWVGPTYVSYKITADKAYLYLNQKSWDALFNRANCDANDGKSCQNYNQELNSQGKYYLTKNKGDTYVGCPAFLGTDYDYAEDDEGGSMPGEIITNWAYSYTTGAWGWVGTDCLNIKQVECIDNSDCGSGSFCSKTGDWKTWSCQVKVCEEGENRCSDANYQVCQNNAWIDKGVIKGKCDVECLLDSECGEDIFSETFCSGNNILRTETDNSCLNYQCVSSTQDKINESCSYKCDSVEGEGAFCIDRVCEEGERMCGPEGNSLVCYGNSWILNDECSNGCGDDGKCIPFTNTTKFYVLLIGSFVFLILIMILLVVLVLKKKRLCLNSR